jgi:hypothetical protein
MAYSLDYQNRWSDDPDTSLRLSKQNAEHPKGPGRTVCATCRVAWAAIFEKDLDRAKSEADVALSLNPNFALAYTCLAQIQTLSGRPDVLFPLERPPREMFAEGVFWIDLFEFLPDATSFIDLTEMAKSGNE